MVETHGHDDEAREDLEYYKIVSGPMTGVLMWRMKTVRRYSKIITNSIPLDTHHPNALHRSNVGASAACAAATRSFDAC